MLDVRFTLEDHAFRYVENLQKRWIMFAKHLRHIVVLLPFLFLTQANCESSISKVWSATDTTFLTPFWQDSIMRNESLLFVQPTDGSLPSAPLLFTAETVFSIEHPFSGTVYSETADYQLDRVTNKIILPQGSRIPTIPYDTLYPPRGTAVFHHRDGVHDLFWAEGHTFHAMQVEITYQHSGTEWISRGGYIHQSAWNQIPITFSKLHAKEELHIVLLGDSISVGANASGFVSIQVPPYMPPFGDLVVNELGRVHGSNIVFSNLSQGGENSSWGVSKVSAVNALNPSLVLLGFGMNDATAGTSPVVYKNNISMIIKNIRKVHPNTEFILIATMVSNPEWEYTVLSRFQQYRDSLETLLGPGIALADLTSIWTKLLERKPFHAFTGNHINHPNDFGHRLYAQSILALFQDPPSGIEYWKANQ